jgi:hypothetical protein
VKTAKSSAHFGFWIADPSTVLRTGFRLSDEKQNAVRDVLVISWTPNPKSKIENPKFT